MPNELKIRYVLKMNAIFTTPLAQNEPQKIYAPNSSERASLKKECERMSQETIEIPLFIGGKEIRTGRTRTVVMPHEHKTILATFHLAGEKELLMAVEAAQKAKSQWEHLKWTERSAIFLRMADLISGPNRDQLNAATMLGQSKNAFQAEIDSACELIDFLRFNVSFYEKILKEQPLSSPGILNHVEYRPLEGFVLAITPFNFTAIAANLPAAPALCGNTVVWKPSDTQMLSAYYTMKLFMEAGLPPGVINLVPADGPLTSEVLVKHPDCAGIHFTGSTNTFQSIWNTVGNNIQRYRSYPRLVGETGGKDFVFAHESANLDVLRTALIRGAFEYQGQKCSAASRAYIPEGLWKKLKPSLLEETRNLKMGDVRDFSNFVNAVIDERSFDRIASTLDFVKHSSESQIISGGNVDKNVGYFITPTLIETSDPYFKTMKEEIFGPVLTLYIYKESEFEQTLKICDSTSPYALTGAIHSMDRTVLSHMSDVLRNASGNLYINDKPTGAVVGQQPFGGARASGTNDKAGSLWNLTRWLSMRTIKENLMPPKSVLYPNFLSS